MPSNNPPPGQTRLNVNLPKDMHKKLKVAATISETTMSEIIRKLVSAPLDEMLKKGLK